MEPKHETATYIIDHIILILQLFFSCVVAGDIIRTPMCIYLATSKLNVFLNLNTFNKLNLHKHTYRR